MKVRIAPLSFIGLTGLVGLNVYLLALSFEDVGAAGPAPGDGAEWTFKAADAAGAIPARPIATYEQTLAHPVFFRTREPFVPPPPPAAPMPMAKSPLPAPPADPGLSLSGVLIGEGVRKAYVTSKTDPRGAWVSEGDDVSGWKVKSVAPLAIVIEQRDRSIEVLLYPPR